MSRLEAVIRTSALVPRNEREGDAHHDEPAETVGITFDGRLFVWHAFPEVDPDPVFAWTQLGPTVTSVLGDDTGNRRHRTRTLPLLPDLPLPSAVRGDALRERLDDRQFRRRIVVAHGCQAGLGLDCISLRRDSEALLKALAGTERARTPVAPTTAFWRTGTRSRPSITDLRVVMVVRRSSTVPRQRSRRLDGVCPFPEPPEPVGALLRGITRRDRASVPRRRRDETRRPRPGVRHEREVFGTPVTGGRV